MGGAYAITFIVFHNAGKFLDLPFIFLTSPTNMKKNQQDQKNKEGESEY